MTNRTKYPSIFFLLFIPVVIWSCGEASDKSMSEKKYQQTFSELYTLINNLKENLISQERYFVFHKENTDKIKLLSEYSERLGDILLDEDFSNDDTDKLLIETKVKLIYLENQLSFDLNEDNESVQSYKDITLKHLDDIHKNLSLLEKLNDK